MAVNPELENFIRELQSRGSSVKGKTSKANPELDAFIQELQSRGATMQAPAQAPEDPEEQMLREYEQSIRPRKDKVAQSLEENIDSMLNQGGHLGRLAAQLPGKVASDLVNLPQGVYNLGTLPVNALGGNLPQFSEEQMPGHYVEKGLKHIGYDVNSEQPEGPGEELLYDVARGGLGALVGNELGAAAALPRIAKNLGKAAPYVGRAAESLLGASRTAKGKAAITGAGAGIAGALKVLQEAGVDTSPLGVGVGGLLLGRGAMAAGKIGKEAAKHINPIYHGERQAQKALGEIVGKEAIPKVLENLEAAQPSRSGYEPTTAQLANNVSLSHLEDMYKPVIKHAELAEGLGERSASQLEKAQKGIEGLKSKGSEGAEAAQQQFAKVEAAREAAAAKAHADRLAAAKQGVESELAEFREAPSKHVSGKSARQEIIKEHKKAISERTEKTGPEYKQMDELSNVKLEPADTKALIESNLEGLPKNSRYSKVLNGVLKLFETDKSKKDITKSAAYKKALKANDFETLQKMRNEASRPELSVPVLDKALSQIKDSASEAYKAGRKSEGRLLTQVAESLDKELSVHPEVKNARASYAKESVGVNQIEQNRSFARALEKKKYGSGYKAAASSILKNIINSSDESISKTHDFMKVFGKNKEAMQAVKDYIHNDAFSKIMSDGVPSQAKMDSYLRANPAALVAYPDLATKLKNVSNATKAMNDIANTNYRELTKSYKDAVKVITGKSSDKVMGSVFGSEDSVGKIRILKEALAEDKTGAALEGAKRSTVDLIIKNSTSGDKFLKFFKNQYKNLEEFFGKGSHEMDFLEDTRDYFKREKASINRANPPGTGSKTEPRRVIREKLEGPKKGLFGHIFDKVMHPISAGSIGYSLMGPVGGSLGLASSGVKSWWKELAMSSKEKTIQRALLDKDYAKLIFKNIKDQNEREAAKKLASKWRGQYISGYELSKRAANTGKEEE